MANNNNLKEFQSIIGYSFNNISLLELALTHSSYANEQRNYSSKAERPPDNERLEFLGDAVLELATSSDIYKDYPDMPEGKMSKYRASIVCEPTLALCAREFGLPEYIKLGKGEETTGGRNRDSICSDALEALIGAIYLDGGFEEATGFIGRFILDDIEKRRLFNDSKSSLQELVQSMGKDVTYTDISEEGPQHDKTFTVEVESKGLFKIRASGHTKKSAQQSAAYKALIKLKEKE